jgi:phosphate transport system permease protein
VTRRDRVFRSALRACGLASGALLVLVSGFVLAESLPALRAVGLARFLTDATWFPASGQFGLSPMLLASALVALGAVALAAPVGVACAVFARFHAPAPLRRPFRQVLAVLAGIPSVVYGLWGLLVLVPWIGALEPPGPSLLAAIGVLGLMILPTVALSADAALGAVPAEVTRGATALGLPTAAVAWRVAVPAARGGIGTGIVLAVGRALGETMAVLLVAGNVVQVPRSVFDPVRTVTANLALEMAYALDVHRSALFVGGSILLVLVALLVGAAERYRALA